MPVEHQWLGLGDLFEVSDLSAFIKAPCKAKIVACNILEVLMPHVNSRVQKHSDALRTARLRLLQIWMLDMDRLGFNEECHCQSQLAAAGDVTDEDILDFMDESLKELSGWTE